MSGVIQVELGARSYPIHIGSGGLARAGRLCRERGLAGAALVVSDSHVDPLYGPATERALREAGYAVRRAVVPAGESSKSQACLTALYHAALDAGLDRQAFFVALGGGVVGDLAGFAAASYLRGVAYVQVPTSLLAMVDSSVGGKTGINLPQGKNLVGAFHQPALVIADPDTLRTLPPREYRAGLAEVVKYGVIRAPALFDRLERAGAALREPAAADLDAILGECCRIKAAVVAADEREGGLRAILNFGHTAGHALENAAGYGTFLHGEAVAVGMAYASALSVRLSGWPAAAHGRLLGLLRALELPVTAPGLGWPAVRAAMAADKKSAARRPRFVLAEDWGRMRLGAEAPEETLAEVWHVLGQ